MAMAYISAKSLVCVVVVSHLGVGTCQFHRLATLTQLVARQWPRRKTTMESLTSVKSEVAEIISTTNDQSLKRVALALEHLCSAVEEVEHIARNAMEESRHATRASRK
jgi:hypothetical protein